MDSQSGARISRKAFIQAVAIIFALMIAAGILTRLVPAGRYTRIEQDGRQVVEAGTFTFIDRPVYPVRRWFTAPFEVLAGQDGVTVIAIILFILLVGVAFAVMDRSGILRTAIAVLVKTFGRRKYALLLAVTFFFMALGGFFGIFEEIIPLVPILIALAYSLGWDSLTGLGISVLATNIGFSTAVFNPFTIGVAQRLVGLPLFSGAGLRILLFVVVYAILAVFLTRHARQVDRRPETSPVFKEDQAGRARYANFSLDTAAGSNPRMKRAGIFLAAFLALILAVLVASPFIPTISELALPLTGLLFVTGGIGAGLQAGAGRGAWRAAWEGLVGIAPAIPLLITLSLTVVPFSKWLRWLLALWFWVALATVVFLAAAVAIGYGPF